VSAVPSWAKKGVKALALRRGHVRGNVEGRDRHGLAAQRVLSEVHRAELALHQQPLHLVLPQRSSYQLFYL
jgi:hypothetical protein